MSSVFSFLRRHKKPLICLFLLIVLAAGLTAYRALVAAPAEAAAAAAQLRETPTFSLTRGELRVGLKVSGSIASARTARVTTTLPYPVAEVAVREGDTVAAGDLIAALDTAELDSQIRAAEQTLADQQAQAQRAVDQAARHLQDARNQKAIDEENAQQLPQTELDRVLRQDSLAIEDAQDALINAAQTQEQVSDSELANLRRQREQCAITAPQAGVITSLTAEVGAAAGELAVIEDTGALELAVNIKEFDINQIRLGQQAAITSGAGDSFAGEVCWIAPRAAAGTNGETVYPVRIAIPEATGALRLGMSGRAEITLESRQKVFVAPLDAVGYDEAGNPVVWTKETAADGSVQFVPVPVTTGLESDLAVEISGAGLSEGMQLRSMAPDEPAPAGGEG